jgi:hypothetical protein
VRLTNPDVGAKTTWTAAVVITAAVGSRSSAPPCQPLRIAAYWRGPHNHTAIRSPRRSAGWVIRKYSWNANPLATVNSNTTPTRPKRMAKEVTTTNPHQVRKLAQRAAATGGSTCRKASQRPIEPANRAAPSRASIPSTARSGNVSMQLVDPKKAAFSRS